MTTPTSAAVSKVNSLVVKQPATAVSKVDSVIVRRPATAISKVVCYVIRQNSASATVYQTQTNCVA